MECRFWQKCQNAKFFITEHYFPGKNAVMKMCTTIILAHDQLPNDIAMEDSNKSLRHNKILTCKNAKHLQTIKQLLCHSSFFKEE